MNKCAIGKIVGLFTGVLFAFSAFAGMIPTRVVSEERTGHSDALPVNHDLSKIDISVTENGVAIDEEKVQVGIAIVDETTDLGVKIGENTDEDFYPENKNWNGIPSVVQAGNNLFIAYYTGGEGEPDDNNYISVAASDDLGQTWQNPWMVINARPRGLVWPLFFYNALGELCLIYGDNKMTGEQMIKLYDPAGPLEDITYTAPVKTGPPTSLACKPVLLSDGSLLSAYGTTLGSDVHDTIIVRSTDNGSSFIDYATIKSTVDNEYRVYAETAIVEKQDGTLWALRRLEYAMGIEQSFSADGGRTWTVATNDLPVPPFYSPGSRFCMGRLQSGSLLFITNMKGRGTDRREMTVWLSEDDGETWPYSLVLDPTQSSYPDFYQGEDGTIYVVHDRDRYGEGGIRLHCFTEEDVKAGEFCSESARQGISITKKDNEYGDIVSVNGAFEKEEFYEVGTELAEILASKPAVVTVTDENGVNYEITGTYRVSGYDKDTAGVYQAYFNPDGALPVKLKDGFSMLNFKIVLTGKSGCGSLLSGNYMIAAIIGAIMAIAMIRKRRERRDEK